MLHMRPPAVIAVLATALMLGAGLAFMVIGGRTTASAPPVRHNSSQLGISAVSDSRAPELALNSLAVAGSEQVAVGSADGQPAVWRETAGGSWVRASALSPAPAGPGVVALTSVTHGRAGWLAVGVPGPVVLTSVNGTAWRSAGGSIAAELGNVAAAATVAGPAGYVIVGKLIGPGGGCIADVWWSSNLKAWTRAHDVNDATGSSQVLAVTALAHGFLSVGSHDGKPAVWTTANGRSWKTIVLPLASGVLEEVAAQGDRVVATGVQGTPAGAMPLAEVSADGGATWQRARLSSPGSHTAVTALTADIGGFTAMGQFGELGKQDVAVWTSPDGVSWKQSHVSGLSEGSGIRAITALVPFGSTLTGIGSIESRLTTEPVILTLPSRR